MPIEVQSPQFVCFTDEPFDAIAEMAQGWDMLYQQLEAGPNPSDLTQLRLGVVDVAREQVKRMVEIHGTAPLGSVVFGLLAEPGGELTFRGCRADSDTLVYQVSSGELDLRVRGVLLSFAVDTDVLARRVGHAALRAVLQQDRVTLAPDKARALRRLSRGRRGAVAPPPWVRARACVWPRVAPAPGLPRLLGQMRGRSGTGRLLPSWGWPGPGAGGVTSSRQESPECLGSQHRGEALPAAQGRVRGIHQAAANSPAESPAKERGPLHPAWPEASSRG